MAVFYNVELIPAIAIVKWISGSFYRSTERHTNHQKNQCMVIIVNFPPTKKKFRRKLSKINMRNKKKENFKLEVKINLSILNAPLKGFSPYFPEIAQINRSPSKIAK